MFEDTVANLSREECVDILEAFGFVCYDDESVGVLREAVRVNIEDDTIPSDLEGLGLLGN